MYWRMPPGYPHPLPREPWFFSPPWPYRWRKPRAKKEEFPVQFEHNGASNAPKEAPAPIDPCEEKTTQKSDPAAGSPSQNPDPAPPAGREREPVPVPEDEGKKENTGAREPSAGPLKWHFPR